MAEGRHFRIQFRTAAAVLLLAAVAAARAENAPETPPEIIPSRRANKFLVRNAPPDYPAIAKLNYIQGRVSVQTIVDHDGEVVEAHVVKGHPFLAVAALKAIRNWLFKPAHNRQGPPHFLTYVDVKFSLQTRRFSAFPDKPEHDLNRQIQPPELVEQVRHSGSGKLIRLRVLVGPDGRVMDSVPLAATIRELNEARRIVSSWTFRPARWGAMAVPWYLEVDVPVESWPAAEPRPEIGGE